MDNIEKEFEAAVRRHRSTIYTVCYMFSNDSDEVADLFQETLINMWKGFPKFRGDSDMRTWVWRVALNSCITAERKKGKRVADVPLTIDINLFEDNDDDTRQIRILRERILRLGLFDRAIILLWLENLSYEEIGAIVGISAKNVSVRLVRIREQLRRMSDDKMSGNGE